MSTITHSVPVCPFILFVVRELVESTFSVEKKNSVSV